MKSKERAASQTLFAIRMWETHRPCISIGGHTHTHPQRRMMKYDGCLSNDTCACVCIDISRTTLAHSIRYRGIF
jgi:hypothetical protein